MWFAHGCTFHLYGLARGPKCIYLWNHCTWIFSVESSMEWSKLVVVCNVVGIYVHLTHVNLPGTQLDHSAYISEIAGRIFSIQVRGRAYVYIVWVASEHLTHLFHRRMPAHGPNNGLMRIVTVSNLLARLRGVSFGIIRTNIIMIICRVSRTRPSHRCACQNYFWLRLSYTSPYNHSTHLQHMLPRLVRYRNQNLSEMISLGRSV